MKWGIFCLFDSYEKNSFEAINSQLSVVQYADKIGLDEAWFAEHHFNDFAVCPNPSLLIANAAARTKNIKLGTAGYLAPFHDVIRLNEEIATLDILSCGRFILGLAKGAFAPDCKHFNTSTKNLRPKLIESAQALDLLLNSSSAVSFNGKFISFEEVDVEPKKMQNKIPMYIATYTSDKTIEFAAENGWGLMLGMGTDLKECQVMSKHYEKIAGYAPEIVLLRTFFMDESNNDAYYKTRPALEHFSEAMRAAQSFNKSPRFDRSRYQALLSERAKFFDGDKFYRNGIIGDAKTCLEKCIEIRDSLPNVHVGLKLLGTNVVENRFLLDKFNEEIKSKME